MYFFCYLKTSYFNNKILIELICNNDISDKFGSTSPSINGFDNCGNPIGVKANCRYLGFGSLPQIDKFWVLGKEYKFSATWGSNVNKEKKSYLLGELC